MFLQKFCTSPITNKTDSRVIFWLSLSLTFAISYAILGLQQAFAGDYIVQDDARQHIFWMQKFINPQLFHNDLIANYYQSVAPWGYTKLYWIVAQLGLNPLIFNKILPLILGSIATVYCFSIAIQILPVPITGFIAALLLNQNLWMSDDLVSATSRAFLYPFFLGFLYYLLKQSLLPCLIFILLLGLFYPPYLLICFGILCLQLITINNKSIKINTKNYIFVAITLSLVTTLLIYYNFDSSDYAPIITQAQARDMPEFWKWGRVAFFNGNPVKFYLTGLRSGLLSLSLVKPAILILWIILPILFYFKQNLPLIKQITSKIRITLDLFIVSISLFILAHILLFKLYLPNRYTSFTLVFCEIILTSVALTIILDKVLLVISQTTHLWQKILMPTLTLIVTIAIILYPHVATNFPYTKYKIGRAPELYQFLQQQPPDILIASLTEETDNLPTFAQRSILVGREYGIPYQWGYYQQFRQRAIDLINAQYTLDVNELIAFINKYKLDFWLIEPKQFTSEYFEDKDTWIRQYEDTVEIASTIIKQGKKPILLSFIDSCKVLESNNLILIDTNCTLSK